MASSVAAVTVTHCQAATHSLTPLLLERRSLTHSLTHSHSHSHSLWSQSLASFIVALLLLSFVRLFVRSFVVIRSFVRCHSFVRSVVRSFVWFGCHSFVSVVVVRSFVCWFGRSDVPSFVRSFGRSVACCVVDATLFELCFCCVVAVCMLRWYFVRRTTFVVVQRCSRRCVLTVALCLRQCCS